MPEPFDVRTEEGLEAGALLMEDRPRGGLDDSGRSSGKGWVGAKHWAGL